MRRSPWARPTSTPRSSGETPVLYAGRLDRNPATRGEDVTGVSSMPMKGSPLIGWTTCQQWGLSVAEEGLCRLLIVGEEIWEKGNEKAKLMRCPHTHTL